MGAQLTEVTDPDNHHLWWGLANRAARTPTQAPTAHVLTPLPACAHAQLKSLLENDYKSLDCFRKENARRAALKASAAQAQPQPANGVGAASTNGVAAAPATAATA